MNDELNTTDAPAENFNTSTSPENLRLNKFDLTDHWLVDRFAPGLFSRFFHNVTYWAEDDLTYTQYRSNIDYVYDWIQVIKIHFI